METRDDIRSHETRARNEDAVVQEDYLRETHEQVKEMVETERSELLQIGEQCEKDIESIGEDACMPRMLLFGYLSVCLSDCLSLCLSVCLLYTCRGCIQRGGAHRDSPPELFKPCTK